MLVGRRISEEAVERNQFEPGDYGRHPSGHWYGLCPDGVGLANLGGHAIAVHVDGTITAIPSIKTTAPDGRVWHGYLTEGVWREC